ncbi:MAG: lipoprotein intramolecular transacylase Lit [bacterium]
MKQRNRFHILFILQLLQAFGLILFFYLLIWHIMLHGYISFFYHSQDNLKTTIIHYLLLQDTTHFLQINELTLYERRHLFDVKQLFQHLEQFFVYSLVFNSLMYILARHYPHYFTLNLTYFAYLALSPLCLVTLAIIFFGFLPTFNYLHSFFFPPQSWIFPKDSTLIQLFPLDYFFNFALVYFSLLLTIFLLVYWLKRKR